MNNHKDNFKKNQEENKPKFTGKWEDRWITQSIDYDAIKFGEALGKYLAPLNKGIRMRCLLLKFVIFLVKYVEFK